MPESVELTVFLLGFPQHSRTAEVEAGYTIHHYLQEYRLDREDLLVRIFLEGSEVQPAYWSRVRVKPGVRFEVGVVPQGGGDSKDIWRIVAFIALAVVTAGIASFFTGWYIFGISMSVIATAVIGVGGSLLINALIPPPEPDGLSTDSRRDLPVFSITGARNQSNPFGSIPVVLGQHRMFPVVAAQPYSEIVGNDQFIRMLFCVGHGPVEIDDLRIGETSIEEYNDVEYEIQYGDDDDPDITIYTTRVNEESLSILLQQSDGFHTRTTELNTIRFAVDFTLPKGIVEFEEDGDRNWQVVKLVLQYAPTGTQDWTQDEIGATVTAQTVDTDIHEARFDPNNHQRILSIIMNKASGEAAVIKGPRRSAQTRTLLGGGEPLQPPTFNTSRWWHLANIHVGKDLADPQAITDADIIDRRSQRLKDIAGDPDAFKVTQTATPSSTVNVAAGFLSFVLTVAGKTPSPRRRSYEFEVPEGQYDVRVKRVTADSTSTQVLDEIVWANLRSFRTGPPVKRQGLAMIAMRIRATNQLNGVIDELNCIVNSIALDWDAGTQSWIERATNNPASIYRHVLQGDANATPLPDARLDLETLQDWHEENDTNGFTFNAVYDSEGTLFKRLNDVAAAGRASFNIVDGLFSVVRDISQSAPVQHFSPRNIRGFGANKIFYTEPHALKVSFINKEQNYERDERVVYDDGFDENNATIFESIDMVGITDPDHAWKLGRYHMAVARLRNEIFTFETDFENLACTRGDLIRVVHDAPLFGLGSARVTDINVDGITYTLDNPITMETGKAYGIRLRADDGTSHVRTITTVDGETDVVTLDSSIPSAKVGDLLLFGEEGQESVELLIKGIELDADMNATLTCVNASFGVLQADQGTIPDFNSFITQPTKDQEVRQGPVIDGITVVDASTGSGRQIGFAITVRQQVFRGFDSMDTLIGQVRLSGNEDQGDDGESWELTTTTKGFEGVLTIQGIEPGQNYDIRVRSHNSNTGVSSLWTEELSVEASEEAHRPDSIEDMTISDMVLNWADQNTRNIAHYEIRYASGSSGVWATAVKLVHVPGDSNNYDLKQEQFSPGQYTFLVKPVSIFGQESLAAATVIATVVDEITNNEFVTIQSETIDEHANGFTGTKTNCTVNGTTGDLEADVLDLGGDASAFWGSDDNVTFWSGDKANTDFWNTGQMTFKAMTYETANFSPPSLSNGTPTIAMKLTEQGSGLVIQYSSDGGATYKNWEGAIIGADPAKNYRIKISFTSSTTQGVISEMKILMRAKAIEELMEDEVIAATDTRIAPINPFDDIVAVEVLAIQEDGNNARSIVVVDKDEVNGPLLRAYDVNDNRVSATTDLLIRGY